MNVIYTCLFITPCTDRLLRKSKGRFIIYSYSVRKKEYILADRNK